MAVLSEERVDEIRRQSHIEHVIGSYLHIEQAGRNFKAVCPFHSDHDPSLHINVDKQIYKCFSCSAGGNVFTFVMNYENVSFKQAVKRVCEIEGIPVDFDVAEQAVEVSDEKKQLFKLMNEVINFCTFQLRTEKGQEVVEYLHKRGLDDETINYFHIGYNPSQNALYNFLSKKGYSDEDMIRCGVCRLTEYGINDVFDDRIMFPIHDEYGNPIAFSARDFSNQDRAKYINSNQNELYSKSTVLYNAYRQRENSQRPKELFVVEGPMDVIALYRAGFKNAVATFGTAFTKEQANKLKRLTKKIILCYDGDNAGQNANYKAGKILCEFHMPFEIVKNKSLLDPDEIINQKGKEELKAMLEMPQTWIEFLFSYNQRKYSLENYEEKKQFTLEMLEEINNLQDEYDRNINLDRLSNLTAIPANQLQAIKIKTRNREVKQPIVPRKKPMDYTRFELAQRLILAQMLHSHMAANLFEEQLGSLNDEPMHSLSLRFMAYYRNHDEMALSDLLSENLSEDEKKLLFELEENDFFPKEYDDQALLDAFEIVFQEDVTKQIDKLKKQAFETHDEIEQRRLFQKIIDLQSSRKGDQ